VKEVAKRVNDIAGVKESDTGLAPPSRWDLVSDKQAMQEEQPLQVRAVVAPACLATLLWAVHASAAAAVPGARALCVLLSLNAWCHQQVQAWGCLQSEVCHRYSSDKWL
jgi:hypothetical protein